MRNSRSLLMVQVLLCVVLCGCAEQSVNPVTDGQDIRITFLHTSDIHSRLIPYDMTVLASDRNLGLLQENQPFGGIARLAHVIQRERARGERVLYVDSGDCFQGAPIFNAFHGEIEQRVMSQLRPDGVVIGNHEFDEGLNNYVKQLKNWASYPVLAANYLYVPGNPLAELSRPYHIANVGGVRVALIGIANFSSISSITDVGNSLKIIALNNLQVLQEWIDFLKPNVDLVIGVSHAGLGEDEEIIEGTTGFDIIFGGHLHVALRPPKVIVDKAGREVPLVHSGAFAKYVGKLDVVIRDGEVINHKYELIPIDSTLPEDATMLALMEPYELALQQQIDLTSVFGYASKIIRRFGFGGGDAPLGNLVADAIRFQARSDFAMTNTLGIRADISEGPITFDGIFNVFPFNNTVTTMFISGVDVKFLFDYVARRSAGRGCNSQVQVAGIQFTMNCNGPSEKCPNCPRAENIALTNCSTANVTSVDDCTTEPLDLNAIYEMATNDYIAGGGSGFTILRSNNTQYDTGLPMRDAVLEAFTRSPQCVEECRKKDGRIELAGCSTYEGCVQNLTAFHDRLCKKLDTTDLDQEVSDYCGQDDMRCETSIDCLQTDELCPNGQCQPCKHSFECDPAGCEGGECRCVEGNCVADRMLCVEGRCAPKCAQDSDCPLFDETKGQLKLCIGGGCIPRPATPCITHEMCNPSLLLCYGDTASCEIDSDCGAAEECTDRRCVPKRTKCPEESCPAGQECLFGWCQSPKACTQHEDCSGVCLNGQCQDACSGCVSDGDCAECSEDDPCGPDFRCRSGRCVPKDADVLDTGSPVCVRGLCMPRLSQCRENRCRTACWGQSGAVEDCPAANVCTNDLCRPRSCFEARDAKTRCHIKNESLNSERCISIPCPRAESDGRIKTVLPKNLEELPDDLNPDDIE